MYYTKTEEIAEMTATLQAIACNDEHPWQERAEYILGEVDEIRFSVFTMDVYDVFKTIDDLVEEQHYLLADFIKEMMHG